jgi:WD40 repeat protein
VRQNPPLRCRYCGLIWFLTLAVPRQKTQNGRNSAYYLGALFNKYIFILYIRGNYHPSSLMMRSDPQDLRRRASWDGVSGISRRQLLDDLQCRYEMENLSVLLCVFIRPLTSYLADHMPPSTMIPQHRCRHHSSPVDPSSPSLFSDYTCDKESFPGKTTTILEVHSDEVWNVAWSHDGTRLASASKDKTAIIWRIGVSWTDSQHLPC